MWVMAFVGSWYLTKANWLARPYAAGFVWLYVCMCAQFYTIAQAG